MSRFSEPALGKCEKCGDQLLSVSSPVPFHAPDSRQIICPICTLAKLNDALERLRYVPTPDEEARMSE